MAHNLRPRSPRAVRAHDATFPKDRAVQVSDGTRVAFTVLGRGPKVPVVFVHGWTCSDGYWAKIGSAVVDAGYPAVFVDMRGHGESGLPRRPGVAARCLRAKDVSAERLARDVEEPTGAAHALLHFLAERVSCNDG